MPHFPTVWKWHQIKFQVLVIQDQVVFLAMPTPQKNLVWRGRKITTVKVEYPLRFSTQIKFKLLQQQRCLWKTRSFICFKKTFHRHWIMSNDQCQGFNPSLKSIVIGEPVLLEPAPTFWPFLAIRPPKSAGDQPTSTHSHQTFWTNGRKWGWLQGTQGRQIQSF